MSTAPFVRSFTSVCVDAGVDYKRCNAIRSIVRQERINRGFSPARTSNVWKLICDRNWQVNVLVANGEIKGLL